MRGNRLGNSLSWKALENDSAASWTAGKTEEWKEQMSWTKSEQLFKAPSPQLTGKSRRSFQAGHNFLNQENYSSASSDVVRLLFSKSFDKNEAAET